MGRLQEVRARIEKRRLGWIAFAAASQPTPIPLEDLIKRVPELIRDPTLADRVPVEHLGSLAAVLSAMVTTLLVRSVGVEKSLPLPTSSDGRESATDRLLTAEEAAALLNVSRRWLYRRSGRLPFARRLSRRTLRFSEAGAKQWVAKKHAGK